jgi:hypothetical protein
MRSQPQRKRNFARRISVIGNAFHRSKAMFAAILACMTGTTTWSQAALAANLGEYKSRGKGKGKFSTSSAHCVAIDRRQAVKSRNIAKHRMACR